MSLARGWWAEQSVALRIAYAATLLATAIAFA